MERGASRYACTANLSSRVNPETSTIKSHSRLQAVDRKKKLQGTHKTNASTIIVEEPEDSFEDGNDGKLEPFSSIEFELQKSNAALKLELANANRLIMQLNVQNKKVNEDKVELIETRECHMNKLKENEEKQQQLLDELAKQSAKIELLEDKVEAMQEQARTKQCSEPKNEVTAILNNWFLKRMECTKSHKKKRVLAQAIANAVFHKSFLDRLVKIELTNVVRKWF